jgi:hypothetical protein
MEAADPDRSKRRNFTDFAFKKKSYSVVHRRYTQDGKTLKENSSRIHTQS